MEKFITYYQNNLLELFFLIILSFMTIQFLYGLIKSYLFSEWDYNIPNFAIGGAFLCPFWIVSFSLYATNNAEISLKEYEMVKKNKECLLKDMVSPIKRYQLKYDDFVDCVEKKDSNRLNQIKKSF